MSVVAPATRPTSRRPRTGVRATEPWRCLSGDGSLILQHPARCFMPPAALLGDGDGAPKARKTGWRVDRAVVVEDARRREREPIGPAERIAPQRRAKLATVPDADVARRGMRRGSFVGPLDRRAHLNAQRGRREREVLNGDRRDRAPRHPAAGGHREPRAGGELAGSAEQNERVQYRGAEYERLLPIHTPFAPGLLPALRYRVATGG